MLPSAPLGTDRRQSCRSWLRGHAHTCVGALLVFLLIRSFQQYRMTFAILEESRRTIVLIANYRDSTRCAQTLQSLFTNAARPDLLSLSLFDQIYSHERTCMDVYCADVGEAHCRRHAVRRNDTLDAALATGPTKARYETEKGIDVHMDTFALAVDSHIVFVHHWDMELKSQFDSLANPKAVLTVYPKSTTRTLFDQWTMRWLGLSSTSVMCYARIETIDDDAMVQYSAPAQQFMPYRFSPVLVSQFAGGFNFGSAAGALQVRNDPFTPFLFHGEEYSKAARLFTHGYDMYAPIRDVVYHYYEERPVVWERDWPQRYVIQQQSKRRIRALLGLPVTSNDYDTTNMSQFGLGHLRSMASFIEFSRIDPLAPKDGLNSQQFQNCGTLTYVEPTV
ncbi:hypothetical protein H257_10208 [Aphanomyces astaci]|uniref:Glycosyltransferase 2-like domain-containing protein n=2 Tax=Aphanomyces astaci TaxID=112090 RepID=W4G6K9_APHAT|nr:hypothetical protein H257_10208 [Aphanomyces astaci]ETV75347.1 hypothetical protein H257_10208 [Aphanomyces astaci]|eukprot:XP_009834981.1 hypothetical protein H257_10208 [Aphanomyces astaci]